jgi:hypothetical protein
LLLLRDGASTEIALLIEQLAHEAIAGLPDGYRGRRKWWSCGLM